MKTIENLTILPKHRSNTKGAHRISISEFTNNVMSDESNNLIVINGHTIDKIFILKKIDVRLQELLLVLYGSKEALLDYLNFTNIYKTIKLWAFLKVSESTDFDYTYYISSQAFLTSISMTSIDKYKTYFQTYLNQVSTETFKILYLGQLFIETQISYNKLNLTVDSKSAYTHKFYNICTFLYNHHGLVILSEVIKTFVNYYLNNTDFSIKMTLKSILEILKEELLHVTISKTHSRNSNILNKSVLTINFDTEAKYSFPLRNTPMIVPPRPWVYNNNSIISYGGYLSNILGAKSLVSNNDMNKEIYIFNHTVDLVNYVQSQSVTLMKFSLERLLNIYNNELINFNLKIKECSLILKPNKLKLIERNDFVNKAFVTKHNIKALTRIISYNNIFQTDKFWFNLCIDFRGRLYATNLLSYTGDKNTRLEIKSTCALSSEYCVEYDATSSIIQTLAMISLSKPLLALTNLLNSPDKQDFWNYILNMIQNTLCFDKIKTILSSYFLNQKIKQFEINIDFINSLNIYNRDIIKFTIMRMFYGSNVFTISKEYKKEFNLNNLSYKHIHLIIAFVHYEWPFEFSIMTFLLQFNKEIIKNTGKSTRIKSDYIEFTNDYCTTKKSIIQLTDIKAQKYQCTYTYNLPACNKAKSNRAYRANLFHSIDASTLFHVINKFKNQNKLIFTIHDAFIINSHDADLLIKSYNEGLYNQKLLLITLINDNILNIRNKKLISLTNTIISELSIRLVALNKIEADILSSKLSLKLEENLNNK
jgi:hypothetical protein